MATKSKDTIKRSAEVPQPAKPLAKCLAIATKEGGIKTGKDFAQFMSALMGDLISGDVTPGVGNAACNAGGKLLKVVEMQHRYGVRSGSNEQVLELT